MEISSPNWKEAYRLLDDALDLPSSERNAWLERLATNRSDLAPMLEKMLADHDKVEMDGFLKVLPKFTSAGESVRVSTANTANTASTATAVASGVLIGPYRLVRELGRGGMGSVWLAERPDGVIKRPVALKLPFTGAKHDILMQRFARERDILASLTHTHIARYYRRGSTLYRA
jgi:eukaryotic-like serine/threonine-protein kinase